MTTGTQTGGAGAGIDQTERVYGSSHIPPVERAVVLIDKPKGLTSFAVVQRLRRILSVKKVGHAGTLDPMATGLLICLVGRATRSMEHFMGMPKVYSGTLRLGEETPSHDAETEVTARRDWQHVTEQDLDRLRAGFLGEIAQRPPMYSAVKIGGERLYKKARRGEEVERAARTVTIYDFAITGVSGPDVSFLVRSSKGTYIRSLAHDFGEALGVGAHLTALRREAIGDFSVADAWTLEALQEAVHATREAAQGEA